MRDPGLMISTVPLEEQEEFARSIAESAQTLQPWNWHRRIVLASGEVRWIQAVSRPERQPNGDVVWDGVILNVTERHQAEEALRESEGRYRGLVEHSPEGIVVYCESRLVYVNDAAVSLLGGTAPGDLLGKPILDVVHPDFHALARERAQRSQREGKASPLTEQKYVRLDGTVIDVESVSTPILYQGCPAGQVLIRDITERKRTAEAVLHLNAELTQSYDDTLTGWARALDLRDHETEGHSQRVTELTLQLARAFSLGDDELLQVRRGALLHDIGKMGIPDGILLKPGKLTDDERIVMQMHPFYACEMLEPIAFLRPSLDIPFCHHEKWDGTGYPRGLAGEEIPLSARLFAVVDVWDALRSDRPYRKAWPIERVCDHLHSLAGTHFDPEAVRAFLTLVAQAEQPSEPLLLAA